MARMTTQEVMWLPAALVAVLVSGCGASGADRAGGAPDAASRECSRWPTRSGTRSNSTVSSARSSASPADAAHRGQERVARRPGRGRAAD